MALGERTLLDGRSQRHPRLVLRRRPLRRPGRGRGARPGASPRRAPTSSTSAASRRARAAPSARRRGGAAPRGAGAWPTCGRPGRGLLRSTRRRPRWRARRSTRGAELVNDVTAPGVRPGHGPAAGRTRGVPVVLMHMRGDRRRCSAARLRDIVARGDGRAEASRCAGRGSRRASLAAVILDPGIGLRQGRWPEPRVLRSLLELAAAGHPVLVGPVPQVLHRRGPRRRPGGAAEGTAAAVAAAASCRRPHRAGARRRATWRRWRGSMRCAAARAG